MHTCWILKESRWLKQWRKRYCQIGDGNIFLSDDETTKSNKVIDLSDISSIQCIDDEIIEIHTSDLTWRFKSLDKTNTASLLQAIKSHMEEVKSKKMKESNDNDDQNSNILTSSTNTTESTNDTNQPSKPVETIKRRTSRILSNLFKDSTNSHLSTEAQASLNEDDEVPIKAKPPSVNFMDSFFRKTDATGTKFPSAPSTAAPVPAEINDPHVKMMKRVDTQNLLITIATLFTICVYIINFAGLIFSALTGADAQIQTTPKLQIIAQTLLIGFIFFLISHRVIGYLLGLILRVILRKSFQAASDGKFEIYIGWVSYRGLLDRNQLVISNLMWLNPPEFKKSPFLLRCSEISVSFNFWDMINTVRFVKAIKFEEIIIDSLEVYFERVTTSTTENSLNVWAAIGVKDKDAEKSMLRGVIMGIWQAIINRMKKNITKPFSFSNEDNIDYDNYEDEEVTTAGDNKTDEKSNTGSNTNNTNNNSDRDVDAATDNSIKNNNESETQSSRQSLKRVESNSKKNLPTVEFHRLLVIDLRAHPLDLLAAKNSSIGKKSNNIYIKLFYMHRHDVTGQPKYRGGPRIALPADDFGDKFGDAFGGALVANNSLSIGGLIAASALTNTLHSVISIGKGRNSEKEKVKENEDIVASQK